MKLIDKGHQNEVLANPESRWWIEKALRKIDPETADKIGVAQAP